MPTWTINGRTWGYRQEDVPGQPYYLMGSQLFKVWHLLMADIGATVGVVASSASGAASAKTAAETARDQAQASATAASGSATAAGTAKTDAETARDTAQGHATNANTAKTDAQTARDAAQGHATAAGTAKTDAETARDTAQGHATNAGTAKTDAQTARDTAQGHATVAGTARAGAEAAQLAAAGSAGAVATDKGIVAADKASVATALATAQGLVGAAGTGTATGLVFAATAKALMAAGDVVAASLYDPQLDADGGAWTQRPGASWYREVLGTPTRGSTRRHPLAAIIAQPTAITIFDVNDRDVAGACRMWMSFNVPDTIIAMTGGSPVTAVAALHGRLFVGVAAFGLHVIDFVADRAERYSAGGRLRRNATIVQRNMVNGEVSLTGGVGLGSAAIADLCPFVQPDFPVDAAGLLVPGVVVATAAGASVVYPWGAVFDITYVGGYRSVRITPDGSGIELAAADAARIDIGPWPYADMTHAAWRTHSLGPATTPALLAPGTASRMVLAGGRAAGCADGLTLRAPEPGNPAGGMVAYVAPGFATGWMAGDIRRAWLCDAATGTLAGGATIADRSGKGGALTVVGGLTLTALDCGLSRASGFTAGAYAQEAYAADLDFGTGDWSVTVWLYRTSAAAGTVMLRTSGGWVAGAWMVSALAGGSIRAALYGGAVLDVAAPPDRWFRYTFGVRAGVEEAWVDDVRMATGVSGTATCVGATLMVGSDGAAPWPGWMILPRLAAYMPTPAQMRRMHDDERRVIADGLPATLGGTSAHVRTLCVNSETDTVTAGTGDGVTVFAGLGRVAYYDGASGGAAMSSDSIVAVSAGGPHLLVATAGGAGLISDSVIARDHLPPAAARRRAAPDPNVVRARARTASTGPLDMAPRLHVGEAEKLSVRLTVDCRAAGAAATQRGLYVRQASLYRNAGGTLALDGAVQVVGTDMEVTAGDDVTILVDAGSDTPVVRVTPGDITPRMWVAKLEIINRVSEDLTYAS